MSGPLEIIPRSSAAMSAGHQTGTEIGACVHNWISMFKLGQRLSVCGTECLSVIDFVCVCELVNVYELAFYVKTRRAFVCAAADLYACVPARTLRCGCRWPLRTPPWTCRCCSPSGSSAASSRGRCRSLSGGAPNSEWTRVQLRSAGEEGSPLRCWPWCCMFPLGILM